MARLNTPDPLAPHNAGVEGCPLDAYPKGEVEALAREAGCDTQEAFDDFCRTLDRSIFRCLVALGASSRPRCRDQFEAVAKAAAELSRALAALDGNAAMHLDASAPGKAAAILDADLVDKGWTVRQRGVSQRVTVSDLKARADVMAAVSAMGYLSYAQGPAERQRRSDHIRDFAAAMVAIYCRSGRRFETGKRVSLNGGKLRYYSGSVLWLERVLAPAVPNITVAEIEAAAEHCRERFGRG